MCNKYKEKELEKIQKKIKKLQYYFGKTEVEQWEEIEILFKKYDGKSKKFYGEKLHDDLEKQVKILREHKDLLYELDKAIKLKENQLEQLKFDLEKQDLYIRKQYIHPQKKYFGKIIIVLLIIIVTVFFAILIPSIQKRIEYNPYISVYENKNEDGQTFFQKVKEIIENDN